MHVRLARACLFAFLVAIARGALADGPVKNKLPSGYRPGAAPAAGPKNSAKSAEPSVAPSPEAAGKSHQEANDEQGAIRVLRQSVDEVDWTDEPLGAVVEWLRQRGPVNVSVLWKTLADVGIDAQTPVSMRLKKINVRAVLNELCAQLSPSGGVGYEASGDTIKIASRAYFDKILYTRVYNVHDIVWEIPDFRPPGACGGVALSGAPDSNSYSIPVAELMAKFAESICRVVAPGRWADGTGEFSLEIWKDSLVVRAPIWVHEQIGGPFYR